MKRKIPPYFVINWDFNRDEMEVYDVMPYLVGCWKTEKKKKHKTWNYSFEHPCVDDDTLMPQTFDEFKKFILNNALYQFWARCEYEIIVTGWPQQKKEKKIDVYDQIKMNIDVITKHFMDYINS